MQAITTVSVLWIPGGMRGWSMDLMLPAPMRRRKKLKPLELAFQGLRDKSLTMTYSHMRRPHTTIGAEQFHFRVREGIGWFPLAMVVRQTGSARRRCAGAMENRRDA